MHAGPPQKWSSVTRRSPPHPLPRDVSGAEANNVLPLVFSVSLYTLAAGLHDLQEQQEEYDATVSEQRQWSRGAWLCDSSSALGCEKSASVASQVTMRAYHPPRMTIVVPAGTRRIVKEERGSRAEGC